MISLDNTVIKITPRTEPNINPGNIFLKAIQLINLFLLCFNAADKLEIITHAKDVLTALCIICSELKPYSVNIKNNVGTKIIPPPRPRNPPRKPPTEPQIAYRR